MDYEGKEFIILKLIPFHFWGTWTSFPSTLEEYEKLQASEGL